MDLLYFILVAIRDGKTLLNKSLHVVRALAIYSRRFNSVHNLQYLPQTRLLRGAYQDLLHIAS